jgi:hypothetical protein
MEIYGRKYGKEELLRYIGSEKQLFGIRAMEFRGGDENLVKTYEVETGSGLAFSVGENKGMDIYRLSYKGINMGFLSKAGLHSAYNAQPDSEAFRYSQGCGMLYTCGLTNVGGPCEDERGTYCAHGMVKNKAASDVCARGFWEKDQYRMEISGDLSEAAFYGRNLRMHRSIVTSAGSTRITLEDTIENRAFEDDQIMLLYHFNAGFPMVSERARMIAPVRTIEPATPRAAEMIGDYAVASAPMDMEEEYVYCMIFGRDAEGMTGSALWNDDLQLGLYIKFDTAALDKFVLWKCMRSGDYAFGMLPSNCHPFGRADAKETGNWTVLRPFETMRTHVEIGVLDGKGEMEAFAAWIAGM